MAIKYRLFLLHRSTVSGLARDGVMEWSHKLIKKVDRQRTVVLSNVATFLLTFFGLCH